MTSNMYTGKSGKLYNVCSYNVVCRREIPTVCHVCGGTMCEVEKDELHAYDVLSFECKEGHLRTVYVEKEA